MIEKLQDTQDLYCISGEGALLLFLPGSLCREWSGVSVPTDRQVEAEFRWAGPGTPATDYDRACDVKGYIETIVVGNGEGIVVGEDYPVHWIPSPQGGIFLRITDLWLDIQSILPLIEEEMWLEPQFEYDVLENNFVLFDPAFSGEWIEEKIDISLKVGKYKAATLEKIIEGIPILAHRLVLQQNIRR